MKLPKHKRIYKKEQGQILILFLLILVVGLAIVLAVASRTVTDIRTTTTSDESNRAYFAAEAGVEEALQQLEDGETDNLSLDFRAVNQSRADTETTISSSNDTLYVYPERLARDGVAQIMMTADAATPNNVIDLADLSAGGAWGGGNISVYWGENSNQAIEVSIITFSSPSFGITKAAFDPSTRANFCGPTHTYSAPGRELEDRVLRASGATGHTDSFLYRADLNLSGGDLVNSCNDGGPVTADVALIRIRALYNTDPFPIAVEITGGAPFPAQGFLVTSTGQTLSGVTRKLEAIRLYNSAPSLFDYVLFNGSTNPIEKPAP